MNVTRRDFLRATGASVLFAGVPAGWAGGAYASDAPETPKVRIGIIALTDCSSIVMAHELGPVQEVRHRVDDLQGGVVGGDPRSPDARREPGDPHAARHALRVDDGAAGLAGEADDHPLLPEPQRPGDHAHQGAARPRASRRRQQIKPLALEAKAKGDAHDLRDDLSAGHARDVDALLARLAAASIPTRTSSLITIPPPQMVANMKVGKMDGFCVGEPWNARAIADGIGFTAITTQQMWKDHPEKVLAFTEEFADEESEDGQGGDARRARGEPVERQAREPPADGRGRGPAPVHQHRPRRSSSAACSATTTTATAARRRTSTT